MTLLTGPLVLPGDLLLVPVSELTEEVRRQLRWEDGDFALTRPRLRASSRLVDAESAELLRQFTLPSTVVEAVIRHSRERGTDPEATLDAAYPLLARLARDGFLVSAADADADRIEASWAEEELVAGFTVLRCVQVLEDTELYQVRDGPGLVRRGVHVAAGAAGPAEPAGLAGLVDLPGPGAGAADPAHSDSFGGPDSRASRWTAPRELALKIERPASADSGDPSIAAGHDTAARLIREAAILDHLARTSAGTARAPVAPRLMVAGLWQGRRFLALEWCAGVDAVTAAGELRDRGEAGRAALLALCHAVADAYASLHRQRVLHCDVHPRNVLVAADGGVRLIDFGLAQWRGAPPGLPPVGRGGVAFYFEPEYAAAALAGRPAPAATAPGEQYGVAALLYLMAAGAHCVDFSLERDTMLRQIAESAPLAFAARGAEAWPELEAVLGRALAKSPEERFADLDALAAALQEVKAEPRPSASGPPDQRVPSLDVLAAALPEAQGAPHRSDSMPAMEPAPGMPAPRMLQPPDASPGLPPSRAVPVSLLSLAGARRRGGSRAELLTATLDRLRPGGPLWQSGPAEPPFASPQYGSAGIAYALYRMALAREDAELLSQADLWAGRANAAARGGRGPLHANDANAASDARRPAEPHSIAGDPDPAFYNPRLDLTPETIGRASLYHSVSGVRCVEALIATAHDDRAGAATAAAAFIGAARQPCPNPDLALGRSGLLLGCALLLDALPPSRVAAAKTPAALGLNAGPAPPAAPAAAEHLAGPEGDLLALGDDLLAELWQEIDRLPPIPECTARRNLGIAHGWAGCLYAALRWSRAAGRAIPAALPGRLDELGAAAESWGRGVRWRWHEQAAAAEEGGHRGDGLGGQPAGHAARTAHWMAGWCNGSAGMVHLWTLAARQLDDRHAWQLAGAAAWHVWEASDRGESLCCGLAGRAYALLNLYQQGAGADWLARARILGERAAEAAVHAAASARLAPASSFPDSLYRGRLGVALLAADLERPDSAAMPLFADEGWVAR